MIVKKTVVQLSVHDERIRKKVFVTVSRFPGVTSIQIDQTGKMTVVGEVDVAVIVVKLRKTCNAEIVSVETVKPQDKKSEPGAGEFVAFPVPINYSYQYHPSYPTSYYQPYVNSKIVMRDEPNTCIIM